MHLFVDVFKFDPEYQANEEKYRALKKEILGDSSSSEGSDEESEEGETEGEDADTKAMDIQDETQLSTMALRRIIYLTVMSSLDYEECAHKLLKVTIKPGQEVLVHVIVTC